MAPWESPVFDLEPGLALDPLLALCGAAERSDESTRNLVVDLLRGRTLAQLSRLTELEWTNLCGVTGPEAARLSAAFALGRLVEQEPWPKRTPLRRPQEVHRFLAPRLRGLKREVFLVLMLDVQNRLEGIQEVSRGTLTSSLVHPREVFRGAILRSAAAVLVVHNHPSGDPEPSQADREVTRRMIRAGRLIGIPLVDHIVCAHGGWHSLRESMDFEIPGDQEGGTWPVASDQGGG